MWSAADGDGNAVSFFVDRNLQVGNGDRIAIFSERANLTYRELASSTNKIGNCLAGLGILPEQRVAVLLPDSPEFVFSFMGVMKMGAVAVPLNTLCKVDLLDYYLNDARAAAVITNRELFERIAATNRWRAGHLRVIVVEDDQWRRHEERLAPFAVSPDDTAFWLYTSGSTGPQKGVVHRHESMRICAENYAVDVLGIGPRDVCFSTSKLFFAYGLGNSIFFPLSVGAASVMNPAKSESFTIASIIERFKPTLFFSVPALYNQLIADRAVNTKLFQSVRMCISAGEYLPEPIFQAWKNETGQVIYDGIGSTEALHIFCSNRPAVYRPGTSGKPVRGYELMIVDDDGQPLRKGGVGHLLVKGDTIAKGYWNKYDVSRSSFCGEWLRTGDLYQEDDDGFFRYIGRQGDAFKCSGLWVSPIEIEQALLTHPQVREAAVVASKNQLGLSVAKAFVALRAGSEDSDAVCEQIRDYLKGRLSKYKVPEDVQIVSSLPKTVTGKVARAELRRMTYDLRCTTHE